MSEKPERNHNVVKIDRRKLINLGGSLVIPVPKEWAEQHGYKAGDDIPFMANANLLYMSPETEKKAHSSVVSNIKDAL